MEGRKFVELGIEHRIAIVCMTGERPLNTLNEAMLLQLGEAFAEIADRRDVRAVVLRAEGRAFAAGADVASMERLSGLEAERLSQTGQMVFGQIERLAQPTIALVQGFALGGGMELAMACDLRFAAEDAKFGQPEVTLGIIPGFGGTKRLPLLVGRGRALWLLLSGQLIDAAEAYRIGLVTEVVPGEALEERGRVVAEQLAALAPEALRMVKRAVYEDGSPQQDRGFALESVLFGLCFTTEDQKAGMRAFLEKRKAEYSGG
jgi:enoyl-CoA hydratase